MDYLTRMPFKKTVEDFLAAMGMKADQYDSDQDMDLFTIRGYCVGYDKTDRTYFLQRIKYYPATYYDPPSEDYIDLAVTDNFSFVLTELMKNVTSDTIETIAENYQLEQEMDIG